MWRISASTSAKNIYKKDAFQPIKSEGRRPLQYLVFICDRGSWINLPIEASKTDDQDGMSGLPIPECRQASPIIKSVMTCICLYPNRQIRLANLNFQQVVGRRTKNLDYATDA